MVNAFSSGAVWQKFVQLEGEFVNASQYFPFEKSHGGIWSEFFSDLLVKVGNSIDGVFRLMLKDKTFESYPHVAELKGSERKRDINFFRDFFEPIYELAKAEVQISYKHSVYETHSYPFKEFLNKKNPDWWTAYNHVKHQWFERVREATLEYTVKALAGLFLLNVLHWQNQIFLVRHTDVFFAEYLRKEEMERFLRLSMIGKPKSLQGWKVRAETQLFIHSLRVDESAEEYRPLVEDEDIGEE